MEDSSKYQQMQDEMSRFEAEISGGDVVGAAVSRAVIGAATFGAVQQQLERAAAPVIPAFDMSMMYPTVPPPPPPPSIMVPSQVRMRPGGPSEGGFPPALSFLRPGLPGPQLIPPPPPKPQPVILSAAPKLYKQPKEDDVKKEKESRKRKRSPPPPPPRPEPAMEPPPVLPPPPPTISIPDPVTKPKKEKKNRKYWNDYKSKLKKLASATRASHQQTGGGPSQIKKMTDVEKKFLQILGDDFGSGLPDKRVEPFDQVVRTAGGQVWEDVTLLDWPDDDFRMFCGDLGNDVTDELLTRTFSKYSSFQRAKVIRDKRTNKSKGFGFVSFKDPGDFIKAMKEMDGRYVGSRPIKLRKSTWRTRSLDVVRKKEKEKAALLSLLMSGNKS